MKPWWKVAVPHEDIRKGRMDPSVFAIDLGDVAAGNAPREYCDPVRFFTRTYMTNGLRELLVKVVATLYKRETKSDLQRTAPVVQLVTPFGGGKTHSLLALYHLARSYDKVKSLEQVKDVVKEANLSSVPKTNVACIDGTHLDALLGDKKKEGVTVRTLWGEIAYQLGGAKLYELVKEHDQKLVSPGKERLRKVLCEASPCLVILDETLEYVVRAQDVEDKEGKNLRGQTMAFMQELTGVVASLAEDEEHSAVLVVTLPSSHTERYDDTAERDFQTLTHITRRLELRHSPVEGMEIYEIVRRRLFDQIKDEEEVERVARAMHEAFEKLGSSVPKEFRDERYREKIQRAYPFHPELIDVLYEKWGSLVKFQRTRGVLRLLALVVNDLYKKNDPNCLIAPGSVDLSNRTVKEELLAYLDDGFSGVVDSDIAGPGSKCAAIDGELPSEFERFRVATRVATLIFLHSVRVDGSPGVSTPRVRAATVLPELDSPVVSEALERMGRLWFLYADEKRENWVFRKEPGIGKIVHEKMDSLSDGDVDEFVRHQVATIAGDGSVFVGVEDPAKIPDSEALKFVFLSPSHPYGNGEETASEKFCARLLNEYLPTSPRRRKNTMVFVLADARKVGKILSLGRELLALSEVDGSVEIKGTLSESQKRDLEAKLKDVGAKFGNELQIAYSHVLVPAEEGFRSYALGLNVLRGRGNTKEYVERFLKDNEILVDDVEPSILVSRAWPKQANCVSTAEVFEAFLKYTGVELITGKGVVRRSVAKGASTGVFGYGLAEYPEKLEKVRFRQPLAEAEVELSEKAWLVKPEIAAKMAPPEPLAVAEGEPAAVVEAEKAEPEKGKGKKAEKPKHRHVIISVEVPEGRLADINRGVIKPLKEDGADVKVELRIEAEGDISEQTLKMKVKETLQQLGTRFEVEE